MPPTTQLCAILNFCHIGVNTNSRKSCSYHKFHPLFTELGGDDLQSEPRKRNFFDFSIWTLFASESLKYGGKATKQEHLSAIISHIFPYWHQTCYMDSGQPKVSAQQSSNPAATLVPLIAVCSYIGIYCSTSARYPTKNCLLSCL